MFRSRGQNLRSVFVLLFVYVAMFMLERRDPQRYVQLFSFNADGVAHGDLWRLFTWQFTQAGTGWMQLLALFVTLLLVHMMGSALEEEWGTLHFLTLFAVSTLASAGVAAWLGISLLGTYFVYFTLLFVYASAFPGETFYVMGVVPIRVRVLAVFALLVLTYGAFVGGGANIAALAGSVAGYAYYLTQRVRIVAPQKPVEEQRPPQMRIDTTAVHNGARFVAIRQAFATRNNAEIDRLLAYCERETIAGVNICPPVDFKPDSADGYCIRCEGFAECSARYVRLNRPSPSAAGALVVAKVDAQ